METEKTMSERLDKWLTEVAEQCDKYARETDLDFYVFQSDRPSQLVDLLILGINPGGSESYARALENKRKERKDANITKRDMTMLAQGRNIYAEDGAGNDVMRRKLKRVFTTDYLREHLRQSTVANIYYFNTRDVKALGQLSQDVKGYCEQMTRELIDILRPKRLIFFCTDYDRGIRQLGVSNPQSLPFYLKKAELNGSEVLLLPNPGFYRAYSAVNGLRMGQVVEGYLRNGTIDVNVDEMEVPPVVSCPKKMDMEVLLERLDEAFRLLHLNRYDKKRYRTLPCDLQLTVTCTEVGIRHLNYDGKQNYLQARYPQADAIRDLLHRYDFHVDSAVWLGTRPLREWGKSIEEVVRNLVSSVAAICEALEPLSHSSSPFPRI